MTDDIYTRVRARLDELNLSDNDASLKATNGRNRDFVRNLKSSKVKKGSAENLGGLARVLGRSVSWILHGDDDREIISIDQAEAIDFKDPEPAAYSAGLSYTPSAKGAVPEIDAEAGAGDGSVGRVYDLRTGGIRSGHKVNAEWVIPPDMTRHYLGADPRQVIILPVDGDSMEPTLHGGDRVIVDLTNVVPKDGGIFVIDEGFGPIVKRCRYVAGTDPLEIEIISDNQRSGTWRRPADTVRVIGRVRGRWTRI